MGIGDSDDNESACNAGDLGLISGLGRSSRERNGYPLQYSCWRIPWTEEPGWLQSMGSERVEFNWHFDFSGFEHTLTWHWCPCFVGSAFLILYLSWFACFKNPHRVVANTKCFVLFIFIGVELLCNVVQQDESAISVHISPPSWTFLPPTSTPHPSRSSQSTELSSLPRFPLAFYFIHCSMNYYLTPVRTSIIKKKSKTNKCWRGCRENGTLLHCWWEYKLIWLLWRTVWRLLKKIKNRTTIWHSNPTIECIPGENLNSKRHMHPSVHCSTIYISQDIVAT